MRQKKFILCEGGRGCDHAPLSAVLTTEATNSCSRISLHRLFSSSRRLIGLYVLIFIVWNSCYDSASPDFHSFSTHGVSFLRCQGGVRKNIICVLVRPFWIKSDHGLLRTSRLAGSDAPGILGTAASPFAIGYIFPNFCDAIGTWTD